MASTDCIYNDWLVEKTKQRPVNVDTRVRWGATGDFLSAEE